MKIVPTFVLSFVAFVTSVYAQAGLVTVNAGSLQCGAVLRTWSSQEATVQTYCYAPGKKLVYNTINTVYSTIVATYQWCVHETNCTYSGLTWIFNTLSSGGISYEVTDQNSTRKSGTVTSTFGSVTCKIIQIPWTGTVTNEDGDSTVGHLDRVGSQICRSWFRRDAVGRWFPVNRCDSALTNVLQSCPDGNLTFIG